MGELQELLTRRRIGITLPDARAGQVIDRPRQPRDQSRFLRWRHLPPPLHLKALDLR